MPAPTTTTSALIESTSLLTLIDVPLDPLHTEIPAKSFFSGVTAPFPLSTGMIFSSSIPKGTDCLSVDTLINRAHARCLLSGSLEFQASTQCGDLRPPRTVPPICSIIAKGIKSIWGVATAVGGPDSRPRQSEPSVENAVVTLLCRLAKEKPLLAVLGATLFGAAEILLRRKK